MSSHDLLFWSYVLLGPTAFGLLGLAMMLGRRRMTRLVASGDLHALPEDPPDVTVLIPAKDEGARIRLCLESVLAQDYPKLSVIAIDDRSTDETGAVLDGMSRENARVTALHVPMDGLPPGWLGKCHALNYGARHVNSEWLLFVDSDVRLIQPNTLSATLALSIARRYDALSLLTRLECHTFLEKLVLPLAAGAWSAMNAVSLTNDDSRPDAAYANGQFLLIRRSAYEAVGGHESVKDRITEDVELYRLLKGQGFRTRLQLGARFASTRMHATFRQMLKGWGRIYSGTTRRRPWRTIVSLLFVLVCGLSAYPVLIGSVAGFAMGSGEAWSWLWASLAHVAIIAVVLAGVYRDSGNPTKMALLFPVSAPVLIALFAFALKWCATGRIEWRGTVFEQQRDAPKVTGQGESVRQG